MTIKEVFPNPTVDRVVFQIRFPPLFSMESRIGDYQLKIMDRFPESTLVYQRQVIITQRGAARATAKEEAENTEPVEKIWNFKSGEGVELNVQTSSLDITSHLHKTYANPNAEYRFRDAIQFAVDSFLSIVTLPKITRIGLRYIDKCPIFSKTSKSFTEHYNTALPLHRFSIEDAETLRLEAVVRRPPYTMRYVETYQEREDVIDYALDFDGWAVNVSPAVYLKTTDALHDLISDEYQNSIKAPMVDHMRRSPA